MREKESWGCGGTESSREIMSACLYVRGNMSKVLMQGLLMESM